MAAFDSLVKDILPYVPNCPDSLIESTLRSSCIEFAERSKAYTFDLDAITSIPGVYEYEFDQPSGTDVHQILWMTYDGNDLDPISPRSLELNYSDWRNKTSVPQVYLQKTPDAFWVIPIPGSAVANGIQLAVALKPSRTTSNIDTTFSNSYRDGIVYGTLYRLLRIPAKDWTDLRAAADYLGLFNQEIVQAELKARGGDLGVKRTVKYRGAGLSPRKRYKKYGSEIDY
jgi:hypothetical protein|tara:strand:+ start:544 stop:1227 length:684 start_codon:yes stop_codon:yes gene_type:complete